MRSLLLLVALTACGDNAIPIGVPLAPSADLVIVAHQDDDLYFMQPDLLDAVQSGRAITSVYVTAGNDNHGPRSADSRYEGLKYAYGRVAGSTDWLCGYVEIAGHTAQHCRLRTQPISLVFLAYPDGGIDGQFPSSLLQLWEGQVASATTVAYETTTYTADELVGTVAEIVEQTQPATVRTLEVASTHGRDHTDHMIVGAISLLAIARAHSHADVIAYRGYSMLTEPTNKAPAMLAATSNMVTYYEACTGKCAPCGEACETIEPQHVAWFARRYAIGFRHHASGRLQTDGGCVDGSLAITDCATAPTWTFDDGALELAGQCLQITATGDAMLGACTNPLFVDDEGHIWSTRQPAPDPDMAYAHLWCLAPTESGGVHARLCGRDQGAPTWTFVPRTVTSSRSALALPVNGLKLGDIDGDGHADLCAVDQGVLVCAFGDGAGGFLAPAQPRFALPIAPGSLAFGDIDGDGRADACGRDGSGVLCAIAANDFAITHVSDRLNACTSLAAVDRQICGVDANGIECTSSNRLSSWPDVDAPAWPADLDGDGAPDWCTATATGPACAVDAEAWLSTEGAAWSFSQAGVADTSTLDAASTATGDIDGDGRDDLCTADGGQIFCARSQGRGFGPRVDVATLPAGTIFMGDLDGDQRADVCVDTGAAILCAL
ncbi:MAG: FG-GAP-like repeat-containing protein [Kofleriaceae bacterium]